MRLKVLNLGFGRPILVLEGQKSGLNVDLGLSEWGDRQMDGQMEGHRYVTKFTPMSYRTPALWGRCPKRTKGQKKGY